MKLTAEQIAQNWDELLTVIKTEFTGSRKDNLLAMYTDLEDRMSVQPASSFDHYHNAFEGGYVDHVLRVIKCAKQVYKLWTEMGADMSGYIEEELLFVALNVTLLVVFVVVPAIIGATGFVANISVVTLLLYDSLFVFFNVTV